MSLEMSELERRQNELELRKVAGKTKNIEINERSLEATRKAIADKGLVITKESEYPKEDFHLVRKQKLFDSLVDPKQGIKKVIESMVRQPVTIFNKQGKPEVKDALYYNGNYYGTDKRGNDLGAPFDEGSFKKPKMSFSYSNPTEPYDPKTGERRGQYAAVGYTFEHYIYLPEDKKERRKVLEDIIKNATGTHIGNLERHHLHFRNPTPNNDHSGTHGGSFNWNIFCDLSLEELGECQNKRYYKEKSTGLLKDKDGVRVEYNTNTGKMDAVK